MNTNIKGTAKQTLEYTGIVTLSQYIGGKRHVIAKLHNKGGKKLFNFLADCLLGDFNIAQYNRPLKILLLTVDQEDRLSTESSFIRIMAKPEKEYSDSEGIVRYSFMIPQDFFAGKDFNAIGLYTEAATEQDIDDYAAYCKVNVGELNLSITSVLLLDWELHISN